MSKELLLRNNINNLDLIKTNIYSLGIILIQLINLLLEKDILIN